MIFEPLDFIARLAALVPPPRLNLTRFHGVFVPNSPHRARIAAAPRPSAAWPRSSSSGPSPGKSGSLSRPIGKDRAESGEIQAAGFARISVRTRSILAMPIKDRDGMVFAVAQLLNPRDGKPFDASDQARFGEIVGQLGLILETLQRLNQMRA